MQTSLSKNHSAPKTQSPVKGQTDSFEQWPYLERSEQIQMIREGIPARQIAVLAERLGFSKKELCSFLRISPGAISRKISQGQKLTGSQSELVLNIFSLIGQVQSIVEHAGNPDGFDTGLWLGDWLKEPLPALDWALPASYLDTNVGIRIISNLIACMESGAYV